MANTLRVTVEFGGGAELLFRNKKQIELDLDAHTSTGGDASAKNGHWTIKQLIAHLKDKHLQERPELFVDGDSIRPGILILVNETDWELLGELNYELKSGDKVLFISTLHGG